MIFIILQITLLIFNIHQSLAISCYSCVGQYNDPSLNCSKIAQNDSCYIDLVNPASANLKDGNWIVKMGAFKETNDSTQFPAFYKKPKSGSDFVEFYYVYSDDRSTNQIMSVRFFCYTNNCNDFKLIAKFLAA